MLSTLLMIIGGIVVTQAVVATVVCVVFAWRVLR